MSANFVRTIRRELKCRPMLPFGAAFDIGRVGVIEDEQFSPRGTVESILGIPVGEPDKSIGESSWQKTSGKDVKLKFLAAGQGSTLFPDASTANAKIEVSFAKADSFLASVNALKIMTLRDPKVLIDRLIDAYGRGMWRKEYILIYQIVIPTEVMILISKNAGTNLLLSAAASNVPKEKEGDGANIAGKFQIEYQTQDVLRLDSGGQPLFYNAYRVRRSIWSRLLGRGPKVVTFAATDSSEEIFEQV
jgi:hypothetical protein